MPEDKTKELTLEDRTKLGYKEDFDPANCKKKKHSKEYYQCKEAEKGYKCLRAIKVNETYYCPRER
jgi:hypothetical protein